MVLVLLMLFSIFDFVVGINDDEGSSRDAQRRFTYGNADEPPFFIQAINQ